MTITATATKLHPVAASLLKIQSELGVFFKERKSCIQAVTLALLTGEHVIMIGPPGTGKTMLIHYYFQRFTGAVLFEQLLSKNLPTETVLGPSELPALSDRAPLGRPCARSRPPPVAQRGLLPGRAGSGRGQPTPVGIPSVDVIFRRRNRRDG